MADDTRKGFLTPEQEALVDRLIPAGKLEKVDGLAIRLIDNQGLERTKAKIVKKFGEEVLESVYDVVDAIMEFVAEVVPTEEQTEES